VFKTYWVKINGYRSKKEHAPSASMSLSCKLLSSKVG